MNYDFEKFFRHSLDLLSIQTLDGIVLQVNGAFEKILGFAPQELIGTIPFDRLHPDDREHSLREFEKLKDGISNSSIQNRYLCADGTYRHFQWTGYPDLETGLVYITGRDITELVESNRKISQLAQELKKANDTLFEQACTDPLTGLKNRRFFDEELKFILQKSKKQNTFFSLLMIDVDHFKNFNDSFGHAAGDRVLITVASLLEGTLRGSDLLARYGGEEFIAALPGTSEEEAIEIGERLAEAVRAHSWKLKPITISVGIATEPFEERSLNGSDFISAMTDRADFALYRSKQEGRDRVTHAPRTQKEVSK
ncbi:sensor domain-containing diguanylate cyclase [Leptospira ellisii]|uniref:diguanylate cyclase n=2 Tax=Leptospira ellisii TaxID=2023197 RepID=A0AAE4U305_9LEPT|nr:sensor domain-containing diguanylate cyclase [Leptospira ellisii]MDV6237456.1 sensor domain-containing diguanylate cyclase [Leptospira ellisii]